MIPNRIAMNVQYEIPKETESVNKWETGSAQSEPQVSTEDLVNKFSRIKLQESPWIKSSKIIGNIINPNF